MTSMLDWISSTSRDESLVRNYSGQMLITLSVGMVAISIGRLLLPPLLPTISTELQLTKSQSGIVLSAMWAFFAVLQFPAGRLSDRLSRPTILVAGLLVMISGFGILSIVPSYLFLLVGVAFIGAGSGLYIVSMRAFISDLFTARRGQAFGVNTAAGMMGGIFAAGLTTVIITRFDWRMGYIPLVAILVLVATKIHTKRKGRYIFKRIDLGLRTTIARVFGTAEMRWLVVEYSLVMFAWQGVFGFLPTFLRTAKGFQPELANAAFAIPFGIGIVVMPLAGGMSDRIARLPVAIGALLFSSLGLAFVIFETSTRLILVGIFVFGVGLVVHPPVMQAYLMDVFPDSNAGGDFGAFRTLYLAAASLGPAYVGWIAQQTSYTFAYQGLVVCLFLSAVILIRVATLARSES